MSIFPNCVKNRRVQALSDSVKSLNDRNKTANERKVKNCDLRIDRDMCIFVIMYM